MQTVGESMRGFEDQWVLIAGGHPLSIFRRTFSLMAEFFSDAAN